MVDTIPYYGVTRFGRAIRNAGDHDGDGVPSLVIGGPGYLTGDPGRVQLPNGQFLVGHNPGDRFGEAVEGNLRIDADGIPDVLVGAPGDDAAGLESGSVSAFSGATGALLYTIHGSAPGDEFGSNLVGIGDLDQDGRDDYLVTASQAGSTGRGEVRVLSGRTGGLIRLHQGVGSGDRFGSGSTGLGDLDGDGVPDYAIGAPFEKVAGVRIGRARVYSGAQGSAIRTFDGAGAGDAFGYALGSGTDADRDGIQELLVGAPRPASPDGGYCRVYSGAGLQLLVTLRGLEEEPRFGASVAGVGDFDGDGHGDFAVGAPTDPSCNYSEPCSPGSATIFSGANGRALARIGGAQRAAGAGTVAAAGDVDGDGLADVAIATGYRYYTASRENVVVLARSSDQAVVNGPTDRAAFGRSIAGVGDVDGDGFDDLLIGAPEARAADGTQRGSARLLSGKTMAVLFEFQGNAPGDRLGEAVCAAGDVNGDGTRDLLVGSADERPTAINPNPGYAKLFSGSDGSVLRTFHAPAGDPTFGRALAGDGDLDGDGRPDLVIGGATLDLHSAHFGSDGHARVYSGRTGALLYAFDGTNDEALGARVAILDDLTGDGSSEFLIAVPGRPNGPPTYYPGVVELRSGADGSLVDSFALGVNTGTAVCRLHDATGDGVGDFAISSWIITSGGSYGTVHVFSGATRQQVWSVQENLSYDGPSYGYDLASAGDLNQDGRDDILIGIPGSSSGYADSVGRAQVRSGDGSVLPSQVELTGYAGWDYLGYTVSGLGDCDGDGRPDFAVGAPAEFDNPAEAEAGWNRVQVVCSGYLRKFSYCQPMRNSSGHEAILGATGSSSLAVDELSLFVTGAPSGVPLVLFDGPERQSIPLGSGHLCVTTTLRASAPAVLTSSGGNARVDVLPSKLGDGAVSPGTGWSFQAWFRDPGAPSAGMFGLSDAVRVTFVD